MGNYAIRELKQNETDVLESFLYEAIFVPEGAAPPPRDIIKLPELQVYIKDFGKKDHDLCLVAEHNGTIIGACWVRIMNDYGHVDDHTPSFAISVLKPYQKAGIGTELMSRMLKELKLRGYRQASLSVQKQNYAVRMYEKLGFETVSENEEEYIMVRRL